MGSEVGISIEALAMLGVDYRSLDLPWNHLMHDQEDKSKKEELDYHGKNCKEMEEKALEEQIYNFDFEGHMNDPEYMKERLREWAKAVAAYVHFLHGHQSQYPHADIG